MTGYKDDPRWQAARAARIADRAPGESAIEALVRRVEAGALMYQRELDLAAAEVLAEGGGRSRGGP
jgi:hypothetical protein